MTYQPHSLYLHVPFCQSLCTYCAFNTYEGMMEMIPAYVEALTKEISLLGRSQPGLPVKTVFFGGGTPSLLDVAHYRQLLVAIKTSFDMLPQSEISLEANPNDLTATYLHGLRDVGFNRISIGMQSASPRELRLFNRRHDTEMVIEAVSEARQAGFDNLNLDLIFGIPGQTLSEWEETLKIALSLAPEHFSLYGLELKGGTPLRLDVDAGLLPRPDDDLVADMYETASNKLAGEGYEQYEISNWSRPDFQAQHNLQYWRNLPYLGLGPGAHGYVGDVRYSVMTLPQRYIDALLAVDADVDEFPRSPALAKVTPVDRETEISETIMMGLRLTQEGIQRETFRDRFGVDLVDLYPEAIKKFTDHNLLYVDADVVRLTDEGRYVSNHILSELI